VPEISQEGFHPTSVHPGFGSAEGPAFCRVGTSGVSFPGEHDASGQKDSPEPGGFDERQDEKVVNTPRKRPSNMPPTIVGIQYIPEYLDRETHDHLLAAVDVHPWQMSVDHGVQVYGHHYNHSKRAAFRIGDLPPWAIDLAGRLWRDGLLPNVPNQLVANDYRPGSGMFAHIDQTVFGDAIASVSLGSTCVMQLSNGEAERMEELLLEPRSVLILSDEARWAWKHGIPARTVDVWQHQERPRNRRVSLTFRVVPHSSEDDTPVAR
jgi:alkylated DNA repair dioxygenase AlkB